MSEYYIIKHKPTNAYFPLSSRGSKRGSTYIKLPFKGIPRLFTKASAAASTLNWWLDGPAEPEYDHDGDGRYAVGAMPGKGDITRKREDFEIISINIKEI